jgi:hypothetical protein
MKSQDSICASRGVVGGVTLLSLGTIFLLLNLGILYLPVFRIWWPMLFIIVGGAMLLRRVLRPRKPYTDFA